MPNRETDTQFAASHLFLKGAPICLSLLLFVQLGKILSQEFAMETFNPKAKEFSQQKKALIAEKKQMEEQVETLRGVLCLLRCFV